MNTIDQTIEQIADDLWFKFANESDGWQTTMDYNSFLKAIELITWKNTKSTVSQ